MDDGKPKPISERLRWLVKERRHVQIGVVDDDLLAAANEIDRLRAGWISANETALAERIATESRDAAGSDEGKK